MKIVEDQEEGGYVVSFPDLPDVSLVLKRSKSQ